MKKKKQSNKLYTEKYGNLNVWKKHTLWRNFLLHFRPQKGIKENMPFSVPAYTYKEELQPCLTGRFQGNERYPKN